MTDATPLASEQITQEDREAAAAYVAIAFGERYTKVIMEGVGWSHLTQAFARHRIAALSASPAPSGQEVDAATEVIRAHAARLGVKAITITADTAALSPQGLDAKEGGQRVAFYWKDGSDIREGESLSDRDRRIYEQGRRDERVGEPEAFQ